MLRRSMIVCALASMVLSAGSLWAAPIDDLQKSFVTPPDNARIMVRWWWFGPAVTPAGIDRELKAMKDGGVGGVEVQPTYPLAVDGTPGEGGAPLKNVKWMSPEFLDLLGHTAAQAKATGMRMDLTFGSGWPYGGPMFTQAEGTKQLDVQTVQAAAGQATAAAPGGGRGAGVVFAAFAGPAAGGGGGGGGGRGRGGGGGGGAAGGADLTGMKEVPLVNGVAQLPAGFAGGEVMFFGYRGSGLTAVKRPAFGADGPVIDHLSAKVVDKFIQLVAEPELKACGANPPFACFCDSLEVTGENWTDDMFAEFQKRRGYDLKPLLPALAGNFGPQTDQIRYDFGQTVTELFNDNFNAKFKALTNKYGSRFRIQGYGGPPAALESYAYSDLPEGEGGGNANWRSFRATRYASSASHLMNQPMTSSETFTWLHEVPFRATPLDMKAEVDSHFLDGINQIVCHGWPYTPSGQPYPGWSFYVGGAFDDKNPWYVAMPEISGYMQRVSSILRAGIPANDVAAYMNDSDIWSRAGQGWGSMNAAYTGLGPVLDQVVNAGFNLDGFDDGMLALKGKAENGALVFGDVQYKMVVLDGAQHMPLATARKLDDFTKGGGILIAIGGPPTIVPGFKASADDQKELATIMAGIFGTGGGAKRNTAIVPNANALAAMLAQKMMPDAKVDPLVANIGVEHRHTDAAEIYFVANTASQPQKANLTFRVEDMQAEEWNPLNGEVHGVAIAAKPKGGTTIALSLPAYGSTIVAFTKRGTPLPVPQVVADVPSIDISGAWTVKFADKTVLMDKLTDWTQLAGMQNFSGVASYEKKVVIPADVLKSGVGMMLSFGNATGGNGGGGGRGGGHVSAAIESPVKDAAVVYINGQRAGAAWCPPFTVDVSAYVKPGENTIRIDVGNTAINYLAKAGWPDYDDASLRVFGAARFATPGRNNYTQPLPSGLTGPLKLEAIGK